jgi:iron complex outermembrane recepter protein
MCTIVTRKHLFSAILLAGIYSAGAQAQLEEVIVTAQKRVESLQDIPVAISAYDDAAIESMGLFNARDIGQASPSLQMPAYPLSNNNLALFIRGIGNTDSIVLTKDPTVGIYHDGVYVARSTGLLADLADLERVEILRGPQGTLYGRNTTAGAINFIYAKPSGEFGFKQRLSVGNYDSWRSITHLDLPEFAGFKAKLAASFSDRDGWVDNEGPNQIPGLDYEDYYQENNEGYRVALRYDAIDRLVVDYAFDYSDMETTPGYYQYAGPTGGLDPAFNPITRSFTDRLEETRTPTGGGRYAWYLPLSETDVEGHNLTITFDLSDHLVLKSITGYREFDDDISTNFAKSFGNAGSLETNTQTDHEQFSQELQLVGSHDRLHYTAGLYYFDEEGTQKERQYLDRGLVDQTGIIALDLTNMPPTPCSDGSTSAPFCSDFTAFFPVYLGEYAVDTDVTSWSAFGQATWNPGIMGDRLDLTLGLRYTDDDREAVRSNDGLLWNSFGPGVSKSNLDNVDYTAVANYRWTDDVSTYFKVSTGFRSGGSSRNGINFNNAFDDETLISYELGWKSELLNRRLRLNGAVFHMEIEDIILDYLPDPVNSPQFVEVFNSGDADIDGLEIDLQAAITDHFLVGFNYAFLDYQINDAIFPDGSDRTKSTELVWAPEHAWAATADFDVPLGFGILKFHLDYSWQDEQYALANTDAGEVLVDDFGLLNGRISLAEVDLLGGSWQFALWGKNLTDEDSVNYKIGATAVTFLQPLMYGGEVIVEF